MHFSILPYTYGHRHTHFSILPAAPPHVPVYELRNNMVRMTLIEPLHILADEVHDYLGAWHLKVDQLAGESNTC